MAHSIRPLRAKMQHTSNMRNFCVIKFAGEALDFIIEVLPAASFFQWQIEQTIRALNLGPK